MPRVNRMRFIYDSEPGDFVGGGKSQDVDIRGGGMGEVEVHVNETKSYVTFSFDSEDGNFWGTISLQSPERDEPLKAGVFDTQRFGHDGYTGFDVGVNHRGSNACFGKLSIIKIQFSKKGELVMLVANFIQHSERPTAPALRGQIYYYRRPQSARSEVIV